MLFIDWSSDVCSSDLVGRRRLLLDRRGDRGLHVVDLADDVGDPGDRLTSCGGVGLEGGDLDGDVAGGLCRSEARRVGQACVSTCRSRWSTYTSKKQSITRKTKNTIEHNEKRSL